MATQAKQQFTDKLGRVVSAEEACDARGLLRDGYGVHVPVMLCDSWRGMMGAKFFSIDQAAQQRVQDAYEEMKRNTQNAWRGPNAAPLPRVEQKEDMSARDAVKEARQQMIADASDAWRKTW